MAVRNPDGSITGQPAQGFNREQYYQEELVKVRSKVASLEIQVQTLERQLRTLLGTHDHPPLT